jgi:hypothetical protein
MVALVVAVLLAWPGVHHMAWRVWHFDAWRFGGFAMYTQPKLAVATGLVGETEDRWISLVPTRLPTATQQILADQKRLRRALGALARPDVLAQSVLGQGGLQGLVVVIKEQRLQAARVVETTTWYRYDLEGLRDVVSGPDFPESWR